MSEEKIILENGAVAPVVARVTIKREVTNDSFNIWQGQAIKGCYVFK